MPPSSENIFPWIGIAHNLCFGLKQDFRCNHCQWCILYIFSNLQIKQARWRILPSTWINFAYASDRIDAICIACILHILHHIVICIYLQRLCPAFIVILQPTLRIPFSGFATSPQLSHLLDNIARHFTLDVLWLPVATLDEQPVGVLGNSAVRPPPRSLREEAPSTRDKRGRRDEIWVKTLCIQGLLVLD